MPEVTHEAYLRQATVVPAPSLDLKSYFVFESDPVKIRELLPKLAAQNWGAVVARYDSPKDPRIAECLKMACPRLTVWVYPIADAEFQEWFTQNIASSPSLSSPAVRTSARGEMNVVDYVVHDSIYIHYQSMAGAINGKS